MTDLSEAHAVVLAGGIGSRFWPASTPSRPKQLLPLGGANPLILDTVDRAVALVGLSRVHLVASDALARTFRAALPQLESIHVLRETEARGTGPALALAAHHLASLHPDAAMISLHADHIIRPLEGFRRTVRRALAAARADHRLYCIGVRPTRPETGYGYVRLGPERTAGVFEVERFVEKPDEETASGYIGSGRYLWNTGIFVWRVRDFLSALRRFTPEVARALPALDEGDVAGFFGGVQPISVDVGVMERADAVGVVEAEFEWDDVGVWNALARTRPADEAGNVLIGLARAFESADNVVWAEDAEVTLFGVSGLVVVRSGAHTLVTTRRRAPDLKSLVERLRDPEA